jgi:hypothetical protein
VKELDFVYWCTRTGSSVNSTPSTNTSDVLNTLDWYDTYRRRVCTENNWRHGNSEQTVLQLSCSDDSGPWERSTTCATGAIFECRVQDPYTPQTFAVVELTGHSPITDSSDDDASDMSQSSGLEELQLSDIHGEIQHTKIQMSERFVVTLVYCRNNNICTMEIRDRRTLELRRSRSIPYTSRLQSISGRWILLCTSSDLPDDTIELQLIVWNLESGVRCPGHIDVQQDNSYCIHKVDEKYATVYTTTAQSDETGTFEWALYQFSLDKSVKLLKKGCLQANVGIFSFWSVRSLDSWHVVYEARWWHAGKDNTYNSGR